MRRALGALLVLGLAGAPAMADELEDRVRRLERQMSALERENKTLGEELEAKDEKIGRLERQLEGELGRLRATVEGNSASIKQSAAAGELDKVAAALELKFGQLGSALKSADEEIKRLWSLKTTVDDWKSAMEMLKLKSSDVDRLREESKASRDALKVQIDGLRGVVKELEARLREATQAQAKAEARLAEVERKPDAFTEKELKELKKAVFSLEEQRVRELDKQLKIVDERSKRNDLELQKQLKAIDDLRKDDGGGGGGGDPKRMSEALLGMEAFVRGLAEALPKQRAFLGAIAGDSDVQKAMAYHMSTTHVRGLAEGLLKYETFIKGVEYQLVKSDRFLRAEAEAHIKLGALATALSGDERALKGLATNLAKEVYLRDLIESLSRSGRFASAMAESSTFTEKLAKSSRLTRTLAENDEFVRQLKRELGD